MALAVMIVGVAVVLVSGWVLIRVLSTKAQERRQSMLDKIAASLENGETILERSTVTGTRRGATIGYRFLDRGLGSDHKPFTEVDMAIPPDYPLTLRIERGRPSPEELARGHVLDLPIGDPAFDDKFIIEAAPSDIVRELLDAQTRDFLLANTGELTTPLPGVLRLAIPTWAEDPHDALVVIDACVHVGGRIRAAYAAANAAIPQGQTGSPYRPDVDDAPQRAAEAKRLAELAEVERIRADREIQRRAGTLKWITISLLVFGAMIAVAVSGR